MSTICFIVACVLFACSAMMWDGKAIPNNPATWGLFALALGLALRGRLPIKYVGE